MYLDSGWRPSGEEPAPRKPRLTRREERVLLWIVAVNALLLVVAPIGGSTVIHALVALVKGAP